MANQSILTAFQRMWEHVVNALAAKSPIDHNHNDDYYIKTDVDVMFASVDEELKQKVNTSTLENYYTETEVDNLLSNKSDSTHNHNNVYDLKGAANEALTSANSYTDGKVANLASTTVVDNKISAHDTNAEAHNDIRDLIAGLNEQLELFLDVDDTTKDQLSEVLALIEANKGTLESLTTSKINVSAIVDNLTTASTDKVLSANQGVVISGLISALSTELKALESTLNTHNHDDRYYTEAEINDQVSTINTSISNIVDGITTVAKASKDASDNVITTTYETKTDAENKLSEAKSYTDDEIDGLAELVAYTYETSNDASSKLSEAKSYTDDEISKHNSSSSAHSSLFATKANVSDLNNYYTKTETDALELITLDDIDAIYSASIQSINEVSF